MGIFGRLAHLIKSNINDLISKSEDPEKMLNQMILELNNQLVEAKKQVAVAIADEKRQQKQLESERALAAEWENKAMLAVRKGNDELAKEALVRKAEHDALVGQFAEQWKKQKEAVENLKNALRLLNNKIEEAKRKKGILIARKKRAEAQKMITDTMSRLNDASAFETIERMEAKIDQMEAEAEAGTELANEMSGDQLKQKFDQLQQVGGAELALEELKRKMGLEAPAAGAGAQQIRVAVDADEGHEVPARAAGSQETQKK